MPKLLKVAPVELHGHIKTLAICLSNTPVRLQNKTSVWLIVLCERLMSVHGITDLKACTQTVQLLILNVIVVRFWTNSKDHFECAARFYKASGGELCAGGYPVDMCVKTWVEASRRVESVMGTQRNSAYNPGSGGSVSGESSIDAIGEKLFHRILPAMHTELIENLASCLFHSSVADQSQSLNLLRFMQTLLGEFVGYRPRYYYYYQ